MPPALRVTVAWIAFATVAAAGLAGFAYAAHDANQRRSPEAMARLLEPQYVGEDRLAPDFQLPDRTGRVHRLSEYRGKTVILHFWTRTCGPCAEELQHGIPVFDEMVRGRSDLAVLLVTVDANHAAIAPLVPPSLSFPILFDPQRAVVGGKYGTRLFPETWVIDREGVIRARFDHAIDWDSPLWLSFVEAMTH